MSERPSIPAMILSGFIGAATVMQVKDCRDGQIPIETTHQSCTTLLEALPPEQVDALKRAHHPIILKCQAIMKALD